MNIHKNARLAARADPAAKSLAPGGNRHPSGKRAGDAFVVISPAQEASAPNRRSGMQVYPPEKSVSFRA